MVDHSFHGSLALTRLNVKHFGRGERRMALIDHTSRDQDSLPVSFMTQVHTMVQRNTLTALLRDEFNHLTYMTVLVNL